MDKSKEIQMKQHVLGMLHDFMMGEEGGKFKPKSIEVEMTGEPEGKSGKAGLGEFLKEASADAPEMGEDEEMEEDEDEGKKTSLKEFFKRK